MKTIQRILLMAMIPLMATSFSACTDYQDEIDALDVRVTNLEQLVKQLNADLANIQAIVTVITNGDIITNITESSEGYIINFYNHDPIFVRHGADGKDGKDGKDGADGKDGKDGANGKDAQMPNITVELDPADGNYYWKLNGEWLKDPNGTRIRANGINGADGKDGADGVSPQVRINESGIWEVSYDGGQTWISTGTPATGADGKDGADANAIVKVVTHWNEGYVEFITNSGSFRVPLAIVEGS